MNIYKKQKKKWDLLVQLPRSKSWKHLNILKWLMHLPLTMKEHFFNDSPKLSIWMLVEYQGHSNQTYALSQKGKSLQSQ